MPHTVRGAGVADGEAVSGSSMMPAPERIDRGGGSPWRRGDGCHEEGTPRREGPTVGCVGEEWRAGAFWRSRGSHQIIWKACVASWRPGLVREARHTVLSSLHSE